MSKIITIFIGATLVNNYVMSQFLGVCPFLGVSRHIETAFGMGVAVIFVNTLASAVTYMINTTLLMRYNLEYLQTLTFILVIASLVQVIEMFLKKTSPTLYSALGVYLPLITTNCAVLGAVLVNIQNQYNLIESVTNAAGAAIGFTLSIVLFAGIRERIDRNNVLPAFRGFPIALIAAGLMAIAFLGFSGF